MKSEVGHKDGTADPSGSGIAGETGYWLRGDVDVQTGRAFQRDMISFAQDYFSA